VKAGTAARGEGDAILVSGRRSMTTGDWIALAIVALAAGWLAYRALRRYLFGSPTAELPRSGCQHCSLAQAAQGKWGLTQGQGGPNASAGRRPQEERR